MASGDLSFLASLGAKASAGRGAGVPVPWADAAMGRDICQCKERRKGGRGGAGACGQPSAVTCCHHPGHLQKGKV